MAESVPRRDVMAGGYRPILDCDEERVQAAAAVAVAALASSTQSYSFADNLGTNYEFKVVSGYQQVVAGMNYRLVILLQESETGKALGAFAVTVYDRFGDRTVTKWGQEMEADKVKAMMETEEGFDESFDENLFN